MAKRDKHYCIGVSCKYKTRISNDFLLGFWVGAFVTILITIGLILVR